MHRAQVMSVLVSVVLAAGVTAGEPTHSGPALDPGSGPTLANEAGGRPQDKDTGVRPADPRADSAPLPDDLAGAVAVLVAANEKEIPTPSPVDEQRLALAREIVRLTEGGRDARWSEAALAEQAEQMRSRHASMPRHVMDALLAVLRAALRPEAVRARAERGLAERLDDEVLRAGVQWERSALGRRVTDGLVAASDPAQREAMKRFAEQRMRSPAGDDVRERACMQVGALSNAPDVIVQLGEAFAGVALVAMAVEKGQPIDMMSFGRAMGALRPMLRMVAQQGALIACLFVVRDLEDAELEGWLAFLRSDTGGRYARGRAAAEVDALVERAGVMFRTMFQLAPRLRAQPRA